MHQEDSRTSIDPHVLSIIRENERRNAEVKCKFNPITGEGSVGERIKVSISDFPLPVQYLPVRMLDVPLVRRLVQSSSLCLFLLSIGADDTPSERHKVVDQFLRIRIRHDFHFWAAYCVYIKAKGGGEDILFRLNRPQRKLVSQLEDMRLAGMPIRLVLLKARQWGGSTCIQLYMAWLQLVHKKGLNSLIVSNVVSTSDEINDMFDRMIRAYPISLLYKAGQTYSENDSKFVGVGKSGNIHRVPQRNCKIKIGTAERPNSARGGDYSLVHCSEVGIWNKTEKKTPEDIVRSACSGVLYQPYTLIVYESTANGTGNFFHKEYLAAKEGTSQFRSLFVSWFEIEQYSLSIKPTSEPLTPSSPLVQFAEHLYKNRNNDNASSDREEPGTYLYWLWELGATLEAINWYIKERAKYSNHADIASEYPSDDNEAFTFAGRKVFASQDIDQFRPACRPPRWEGEIYGKADSGEEALYKLRFRSEENGRLSVWHDVEKPDDFYVEGQYLVVVDVCKGHTKNADFADILVINRLPMVDNQPPSVVAEWHGHIEMDRLAWKAVQVAAYYNNALLVMESNTLETNNTRGEAEYILQLIHDVYGDQLYARKQSAEDIQQGVPRKFGFHTNTLTKKVIIHNLKTIVREHLYTEREVEALNEYLTYVETDNGSFEAMEGCHDDRLITRAIAMQVCYHEMEIPRIIPKATANRTSKRKIISTATI